MPIRGVGSEREGEKNLVGTGKSMIGYVLFVLFCTFENLLACKTEWMFGFVKGVGKTRAQAAKVELFTFYTFTGLRAFVIL